MRKTLLRTKETARKYEQYSPSHCCFMCHPTPQQKVMETEYWQIIINDFPYDAIAGKHHLLVPKRHVAFEDRLTNEERFDVIRLFWLLEQSERYDSIQRNFSRAQSCQNHLHYHLISYWVV